LTFARTIADILSLAIATQKQFEAEKNYKRKVIYLPKWHYVQKNSY